MGSDRGKRGEEDPNLLLPSPRTAATRGKDALVPARRALVPFSGDRLNEAVVALRRGGYAVRVADRREDARREVRELLDTPGSVAVGPSHVVHALGVLHELEKRGFRLLDYSVVRGKARALSVRRAALLAEYYLGSVDALTLAGDLVLRDGVGNRVAGLTFGPRKTIIVVGVNQIVADLESAFARLEALTLAKRLSAIRSLSAPAAASARLREDASGAATVVIHRRPAFSDATVLLVREEIAI